MYLLRVLELLILTSVFLFLVTQVAYPLWADKPLFPIIRHGAISELETQKKIMNEKIDVAELQAEISRLSEEANHIRDSIKRKEI